jgi:hypothetical protein
VKKGELMKMLTSHQAPKAFNSAATIVEIKMELELLSKLRKALEREAF